jgi:hypothetical protein
MVDAHQGIRDGHWITVVVKDSVTIIPGLSRVSGWTATLQWGARPNYRSINPPSPEIVMENVITIGRRHVPIEQIAYVEPFELSANTDFKPEKSFKARVVLLDRETVLTENTAREFADAHGFRMLAEDNVATNPAVAFRVESFEPTEGFRPEKPYQTRLMWRDPTGKSQSKLLLTQPETVIAVALRGESSEVGTERKRPRRPAQRRGARPRATVRADA